MGIAPIYVLSDYLTSLGMIFFIIERDSKGDVIIGNQGITQIHYSYTYCISLN